MSASVTEFSWVKNYATKNGKKINPHGADFISKLFFWERDIRNILKFGFDSPKSASLIYVNPRAIHKAIHPNFAVRMDSGVVKGGDWDTNSRDINTIKKIKGVKQRIVKGLPWERTSAWRQCLQYLERGQGLDGITSEQDIIDRYKKLDEFISVVVAEREGAYKTRNEIRRGNFREAAGVIMNIDRDGELIFGMRGCHRLAIAQSLELTCIPVQLGIVHEQAVRNGIWRKNIIDPKVAEATRVLARRNAGKTKSFQYPPVLTGAAVAPSKPIPSSTAVSEGTKQRYTGQTKAQSIEFDANKEVHWQGQTVPKFDRLVPIMPGNSLVEIGAAEGILSLTMAPHKERVRAIDITPARHQKALELKARWIELGKPVENCEMVLGDALKHPELIAGFDTLMASRVIYYFGTYLEEFMDNVRKNVDNVCFIGNPVRTARLAQGSTGKLGEYAKYATVPGMIELVERHGFKVWHVDETLDPLIIAKKV